MDDFVGLHLFGKYEEIWASFGAVRYEPERTQLEAFNYDSRSVYGQGFAE